MSFQSIRIIVVNWNAGKMLHDCIRSIELADRTSYEIERIVIVDNASKDGSLDDLASATLPIDIVKNTDNVGFAKACNQGALGSPADCLLFLNPDTRLFSDSLRVPLHFMQDPLHHGIGICGIQLLDEAGSVSRSCARFPTPLTFYSAMLGLERLLARTGHFMREWDHAASAPVDHVIGAFFLVRRRLFEDLHGFDERFFVYLEDLDFSLRARRRGQLSYFLANAQAFHKGGGTSEQVKAARLFYSLRSRLLYGFKHFSRPQATLLALATLVIEPITRLTFALLRGAIPAAAQTVQAYWMLYRALPQVWHEVRR